MFALQYRIESHRVEVDPIGSATVSRRRTDPRSIHSLPFMARVDTMCSSSWISFARFSFLVAVLAVASLSSAAHAQHTHGAHEHGAAELTVALDGRELVIELISPLDNLVGFEHAPANDAQRSALAEAGRLLRDADAMFALPAAAACRFEHADIESPWPMDAPPPAAGQAGHAHAQRAHGDRAHGDHEEVVATYRFTCAQPTALNQLEVRAFAHFPRLRELRVGHATARGQGRCKQCR